MAKPKTKAPVVDQVVYVGPNMPGGPLPTFQAFRGGLPDYVKEIQKQIPVIKSLFVPVVDLAEARSKLKDPKTPLAQAYKATVEALAKGGNA